MEEYLNVSVIVNKVLIYWIDIVLMLHLVIDKLSRPKGIDVNEVVWGMIKKIENI